MQRNIIQDFISNTDLDKIGAMISNPAVKVICKNVFFLNFNYRESQQELTKNRHSSALLLILLAGRIVRQAASVKQG